MKGVKRKMKSEKGKVGKPLFFVGSIVVFLLIIALLNLWMFSSKDGISIDSSLFYTYRMVRICSIVFLLLSIVGYYYYGVIKSQYSEGKKNLALILVSLSVVILLCEIPFSFYAESDGVGLTWAHILWERKYWTPIQINVGDGTILSLRDDGKKADVTKKKILMIGDSFTAGDGLDSASFSYPSLVREKIEEAYPNVFSLVNLGEKGADPYRETNNLITYNKKLIQETGVSPIASKPKILVWQYFGNDVDFTASNFGVYPKYEEGLSDNLLEFLFQGRLFVLDYIYWHLLKSKPEAEYKNYLTRCYSGEEMHTPSGDVGTIKATHMKPVIDIVRTCATDSISFLLVVFPIMTDIKFSEDLYSKEIELQCKRAHVNVVNLSSVFSRYKTEDLIVSPNNPHPSKFAHRIAADTIYRYMLKEGMLD